MKTLNFKTNITSREGVAAVTEPLNDIEQIDGWNLDLDDPNHLLTVQTTDNRITDQVRAALSQAGFEAEPMEAR